MGLNRIVMRLARNPGTEFAGGDDHRGYAPDRAADAGRPPGRRAYGKLKAQCSVRRFLPRRGPRGRPSDAARRALVLRL
ncbi:MAG: hypothetical protein WDM92_01680 [Caulobacteraceae bacterium]